MRRGGTSGAPSIVGIDGPNTSASSRPTLAPCRCEREREVDRDRRLADAALAGGDRDDVLGALEHRLVARRRQERGVDLGDHGHALRAERLERLLDRARQLAALRERIRVRRDVEPDEHVVALHLDGAEDPVRDDVVRRASGR